MDVARLKDTALDLTPEQREDLWRRWLEHHDPAARAELIGRYRSLVRYVTVRWFRTLPETVSQDDLQTAMAIALVKAVDNYDPGRGATFENYSVEKMRGAGLEHLRQEDHLSRMDRDHQRRLDGARASLLAQLRREPTRAEVAAYLGVGVERVETLDMLGRPLSIESTLDGIGETGQARRALYVDSPLDAGLGGSIEHHLPEFDDVADLLLACIDRLTIEARTVLALHVLGERPLRHLAEDLNMPEGQVARVVRSSLEEFRVALLAVA